MVTSFCCF